ncbi:skin secretory protein xP2 [Iris pallida]|uniref:Skin secretory protein xP2 n=1 Tax=Iris pallida TaxID=29817 RepID=A0AAX6DX57_IRIPA|nr:skin secretory protein xP2 [Iris pallida]
MRAKRVGENIGKEKGRVLPTLLGHGWRSSAFRRWRRDPTGTATTGSRRWRSLGRGGEGSRRSGLARPAMFEAVHGQGFLAWRAPTARVWGARTKSYRGESDREPERRLVSRESGGRRGLGHDCGRRGCTRVRSARYVARLLSLGSSEHRRRCHS